MICRIPPLKPVPKNADRATRIRMYFEYCDELARLNPSVSLPRGVKRGWRFWMTEHPATSGEM